MSLLRRIATSTSVSRKSSSLAQLPVITSGNRRSLQLSSSASPLSLTGSSRSIYTSSIKPFTTQNLSQRINTKTKMDATLTNMRGLASIATNLTSSSSSLPLPPTSPHLTSGDHHLILPPNESRPHRFITLKNGLEAILIHDPDCDKAAAALDVGVGHLEDPRDLPGCAHFCEHLMFLGTKKYPEENAYSTYLSANNGHSNAYTAMCNTNYYFDVDPPALEGALDRFAGFFTDPLFAADCTDREIKAVNSEHKKNLQQDMWRFYQLEKHLSKPSHPYSKFGSGNAESLQEIPLSQGRDPRSELISWWKEKYCARRMKLSILGRDDLDTLEKWVRDRFENVPVKTKVGEERIEYDEEFLDESSMGTITYAKPVKDMRGLEISYPYPDQEHLWDTKPGNYIAHFLGHEGPGSVLSYLKRKGLVNGLRAGMSNGGNGFDQFKVTLELTPEGLVKHREVALAICQYVNLLKSTPPSRETFDEIKALADIGFRFVERGQPASYVSDMATWMQDPTPKEKSISSQWVMERFDSELISKSMELLDIRRCRIVLTAREMPEGSPELTEREPIYETEYKVEKLDKEFIEQALTGNGLPELALPGHNSFIPENLDVEKISVKEPAVVPSLLRDNALTKLWFKKDDRFWIPRANVFVSLTSPIVNMTPRNAVLARLFCELFRDSVTEEVYDAEMAGLQFSMDYAGDSIIIGALGYNDKLHMLTEKLLTMMKAYKVDPARLVLVKDMLKRHWVDFGMEEPYGQAMYYTQYAEAERMWRQAEKVEELEHIESQDVEVFMREFSVRLHMETLVHGNFKQEEAIKLQDMVESIIKPRALTEAERVGERSLMLPAASEHIWEIDCPNPANVNSCLDYYCEVGDSEDDQLRPRVSLLAQLIDEPAFNRLRTKEQLGYIVHTSGRAGTGTMGIRILVQSEKNAAFLETRVEAFLDTFKQYMEDMTEEEFVKNRQALIAKKTEKPKNLHGESARFWGAIQDGYYDFKRRERDVATLQTVSKQDIIDLFLSSLHYSSPTRRKLSVHLKSTYQGVKFDPASAMPLVQSFMAKQVPVSQTDLAALMATSPGLAQLQKFARDCLSQATELSETDRKELEAGVDALGGAVTKKDDADVAVRSSNVFIKDIVSWKAGLTPSKAAVSKSKFEVVGA